MTSLTQNLRLFALATLAVGILAAAGCGGAKMAPVSGVVTFDGKPYANAVVSFQPVGGKGNENPGRGSVGITDADGRFTLKYDNVEPGAVVGKHVVRIVTNGVFTAAGEDGTGSDDATPKTPRPTPSRRSGSTRTIPSISTCPPAAPIRRTSTSCRRKRARNADPLRAEPPLTPPDDPSGGAFSCLGTRR